MAGVHRGGLHVLLWQRRTASGGLRVVQKQLAGELGVSKWSMSRILARMAEEGRLVPLPGSGNSSTTYDVVDPAEWAATHGDVVSEPADP